MKFTKTILLGSAMMIAMAAPAAAQSCVQGDNLIGANSYDVLRKGKKIGTHVISFYGSPDALKVQAETHMQVDVMFITAFKYKYDSTELFCGTKLQSVDTYINNNGDEFAVPVKLDATGGAYISESTTGQVTLSDPFITSNHWDKSVTATGILNTATGLIDRVEISPPSQADADGIQTYAVRGDINYDTRYDAEGNWNGMRFAHPKGGMIEFICTDCKNTPEFGTAVTPSSARIVSMPSAQ